MAKILIVEDEEPISNLIRMNLVKAGYQCGVSMDGEAAADRIQEEDFDLILLDIMLPGEDGYSILARLKSDPDTRNIPVILVTARESEFDKVKGLDGGADDYITKPFGMMEFVSRVKAVLRRCVRQTEEKEITCGDLRISVNRHEVCLGKEKMELTRKEFELLQYLAENKGMVMSRNQILEHVWGYDFDGETRTVDVHVRSLRQKLGEAGEMLETVRGVGYRLKEN